MTELRLNERAAALCDLLARDPARWRIGVREAPDRPRIIDCGIAVPGGLETGRALAEICLAGLGRVALVPGAGPLENLVAVTVATDQPVAAALASQYAGWQISGEKFFAMGSGPMRAAAAKEELFAKIGFTERPARAVGVLETRKFPPDEVSDKIAAACGVPPSALTLLVAPTASPAGMVQVVARSVETALHKLVELGFDVSRIASAFGSAPLPPAAADDLAAIGRTNDAVLYGARVMLWVRGDDDSLRQVGPQVPSCASADFGQPFATIFERYDRDFYKIDPHLFSPAQVMLANLDTGTAYKFGDVRPDVLARSFGM